MTIAGVHIQADDLFGYTASLLVFAAFYMKDMRRLRLVAIASNIAFIAYARVDSLTPILLLHSTLLPLNLLRLFQLCRPRMGAAPRIAPSIFGRFACAAHDRADRTKT